MGWVRYEIWGVPDGRKVTLGRAVRLERRSTRRPDRSRLDRSDAASEEQTEYPSDGMDVAVSRVVRNAGGADDPQRDVPHALRPVERPDRGRPLEFRRGTAGSAGGSVVTGEPGDLEVNVVVTPEMPEFAGEHLHVRDVGRQPITVGGRDKRVGPPEPDRRRYPDRTDLEAPRRDEGEIVVQPTIDTFPQAVGDDLFEDGAVLRLLVAIRVRELVLLGEGVRLARRDPLEDLEALGLDQGTQSSLTLE